jgi:hypothetical protein
MGSIDAIRQEVTRTGLPGRVCPAATTSWLTLPGSRWRQALVEQMEKERQRSGGRGGPGPADRRSSGRGGMPTMSQQMGPGRTGPNQPPMNAPPPRREDVDLKKIGTLDSVWQRPVRHSVRMAHVWCGVRQASMEPKVLGSQGPKMFGRGSAAGTAMNRSASGGGVASKPLPTVAAASATATSNAFGALQVDADVDASDTPQSELESSTGGTVSPVAMDPPARSASSTPVPGMPSRKRLSATEFEKRVGSLLNEFANGHDQKVRGLRRPLALTAVVGG